jgi:hypothetical protein
MKLKQKVRRGLNMDAVARAERSEVLLGKLRVHLNAVDYFNQTMR